VHHGTTHLLGKEHIVGGPFLLFFIFTPQKKKKRKKGESELLVKPERHGNHSEPAEEIRRGPHTRVIECHKDPSVDQAESKVGVSQPNKGRINLPKGHNGDAHGVEDRRSLAEIGEELGHHRLVIYV